MISNNETPSFEAIYRNYYRAVFALFGKKGFRREEAEDLAQKTFLRVYESWEQYRGDAIWEYLVVTARSVLSNHLRERGAQKRGHDRTTSLERVEGTGQVAGTVPLYTALPKSPLEQLELKVKQTGIVAALEELPDVDRRCFLLWYGGRTYREIGKVMRCTEQAAKARCFRIRKEIRERAQAGAKESPSHEI